MSVGGGRERDRRAGRLKQLLYVKKRVSAPLRRRETECTAILAPAYIEILKKPNGDVGAAFRLLKSLHGPLLKRPCRKDGGASYPDAMSTGLRTGRLVGVDIDIVPAAHVQAIKDLATTLLGHTSLERIGDKGAMLCYRNETPIGKITVSGRHSVQPGKVEILGVGRQFVSYGIHPDTGKPYTWTNALLGGESLLTPLDKLPEVTPEKLRDFAEQVALLLTSLDYSDAKFHGGNDSAEKNAASMHLPISNLMHRLTSSALVPGCVEPRRSRRRRDRRAGRRQLDLSGRVRACEIWVSAPKSPSSMLLEPGGWNEHALHLGTLTNSGLRFTTPTNTQRTLPAQPLPFSQRSGPMSMLVARRHEHRPTNSSSRFRGRWPDEYEQLPELDFWDDDKTLPRCPDGCIAIVYGEFGSHKTNTVLAMALDAVLDGGARVCYAAGEGAHGVGKQRIPAHCEARGISTKDLRGRFRIVQAVPLFASPEEVAAFIEAQKDFEPSIIVLDTLATAIAGEARAMGGSW